MKFKYQLNIFLAASVALFVLYSCGEEKGSRAPAQSLLKNGDIIFRQGGSAASILVNSVDTKGFYTHTGIVVEIDGKFMALHTVPGEEKRGEIEKIKVETLDSFFYGSKAKHGALYRLNIGADSLKIVTDETLRLYKKGVHFDNQYNLEDTTELYCTELLYMAFEKIGYDITDGNITQLDIAMFRGDHIFPSDIQQNGDLRLIYSY